MDRITTMMSKERIAILCTNCIRNECKVIKIHQRPPAQARMQNLDPKSHEFLLSDGKASEGDCSHADRPAPPLVWAMGEECLY